MNNTTTTKSIWFVAFVTSVTAIGGFLFGYDTAVINGANSYLKANMHLSPGQEGFAGASAILGCIPGAMCAGFLSDRFGRKKLLLACAALFAVSGLLSAVPRTFELFLIARFISGLGIGSSSMVCPVYIAEIAPEKWRGRLGSLFQLGIVSGIFLTLFINKVVQGMGNEAWNIASGWRWMLGMEVVPAVIFFGLLFLVPESPRWLAQKGREQEARRVLSHVGDAAYAETELTAIKSAISSETGKLSELFSRTYSRPLVIGVLLMVCSQFCGINAIMYYSSRIFESAGVARNSAFVSSIWIGLVNLLFTFLAIVFIDRAGRRPLLLIGTAVQAVALGMVGWMFHSGRHELALLLWVLVFIAAFAMAMGPIPWIVCSEIFPGKLRARAMSVATLAIWSSCYLVAQTFPILNDDPMIGPAATFWIYGAVSLFSFFFVLTMIKETKGKSLEEIESEWKCAPVSAV